MSLRLTILGSGDAFSGSGCNAAALLDGRVLIDCGAPIQVLIPKAGLNIHDIELVLVSHFHADHTFMLPALLGARAFTEGGGTRRLTIAGPVGTREYVRRIVTAGYGQHLQQLVDDLVAPEYVVLQDGSDVEMGAYRVRSHAVIHSTGPSLAYGVTRDGVGVGFSGDSTLCPGLVRLVESVDAMVCECTGWDSPVDGGHLWKEEVTELIATHPRTRFVLTHLGERGSVAGAIVAHDLLTLDLVPRAPD